MVIGKIAKSFVIDGPSMTGTRILQLRHRASGKPIGRIDYGPVPKKGDRLHYHRQPDMRLHRPYEGGL